MYLKRFQHFFGYRRFFIYEFSTLVEVSYDTSSATAYLRLAKKRVVTHLALLVSPSMCSILLRTSYSEILVSVYELNARSNALCLAVDGVARNTVQLATTKQPICCNSSYLMSARVTITSQPVFPPLTVISLACLSIFSDA